MDIKKEKGITGIDIASGIVIFVLFTAVILAIYYRIYVYLVDIKVHEVAIAGVTEVFEAIDEAKYENVNYDNVLALAKKSNLNSKTTSGNSIYTYEIVVEKYTDIEDRKYTTNTEDLVKRVTININYDLPGEKTHTFTMKKNKIRGLDE